MEWQIVGLVATALILGVFGLDRIVRWANDEIMSFTGDDLGMMEQDDDGGNIAIGGRHE